MREKNNTAANIPVRVLRGTLESEDKVTKLCHHLRISSIGSIYWVIGAHLFLETNE
jgi:hypothetical protein